MLFRSKKKTKDLSEIERQKEDLQARIDELQHFIEDAPEQLQREQAERLQTIPAPDELIQRRRENDFSDRLTKGEIKNERRSQTRSALLFVLLLVTMVCISIWIYKILASVKSISAS